MRHLLPASLLLSFGASAQSLGGLPGALDWRALGGDPVTVITTAASERFARRALALDEALVDLRPLSLGERTEPIDVVVQPATVVPNGFVGLAPFRSYLYATPPQQHDVFGATAWEDVLAIHEYRHVEQFGNLRRGWTHFASVVAGDAGWGLLTGLSTPDWFFEGDAVYAETALTYSGRGRVPAFTALQRALALAGTRYPYAVARNGSLRRRVPDHYPLGYALVAHGRLVDGDPWASVVRGAGTFWPPFYPFSAALERATGLGTPAYYREALDSLAAAWRAGVDTLALTPGSRLTPELPAATRYATPIALPARPGARPTLYAQRRSQRRVNQLVELDADGRELRVVGDVGANVDDAVSVGGGRAAWSQLRRSPRRPEENYSVVVVADLAAGTTRPLTRGSHLFAPGLSADGARVVAAEIRVGLPAKLVTLDAATGERLGEVATDFDVLSFPRYADADRVVVGVAKRAGALALVAFDAADLAAPPRRLTPWTRHTLGPAHGDAREAVGDAEHVVFSASFTGIDNVFRVPLDGSAADDPTAIAQVTSHPVGAYAPSVAGDVLYYTSVAADGDPVEALPRESWLLRPLGAIAEPHELPAYAALPLDSAARAFRARFYAADPTPAAAPPLAIAREAPERPYGTALRGFSVHTWRPLADQNEASLTVIGSNVLNDVRAELEAGYNLNEGKGFGTLDLTLARTWPWVTLRGGLAGREAVSLDFARPDTVSPIRFSAFQESSVGLALGAPLRQIVGAYGIAFRPSAAVDYRWLTSDTDRLPATSSLAALDLGARFSALRQQAPRHILPRLGVSLDARYRRALDGSEASQLTAAVGVSLPGLTRTHGIRIAARARAEDVTVAYQFPDFHAYARGYDKPVNSSAVGATAEYHLPLVYPDVGVAGIVYAQRLRAAAWADVTRARLPERVRERDETLRSVGVDLTLDAIFFNAQPLPVGVRLAYRLDDPRLGGRGRGWAEPQLLLRLPR